MKKFKDLALQLLICFCILQSHIGVCYRNDVEKTPAPPEESTTQKSGFLSGFKNFFRGSPTTTTTTTTPSTLAAGSFTQQKPPPLTISNAPLMPLGPRPDTPSSSPYGAQPWEYPRADPPVNPQNNLLPWQPPSPSPHGSQPPQPPKYPPTTVDHIRPQSNLLPQQSHIGNSYSQGANFSPNFPGSIGSQQSHMGTAQGQRIGSSPNLPAGLAPYRPERTQPSGIDLSYGGGNAGSRPLPNENKPGFGLAPLTSSTTTTTTIKPTQPQQPLSPQKPQQPHMDIDLRYGSSATTARSPTQAKEDFPPLPSPRRPSAGTREDFPALPSPKSPSPQPGSPTRPSSPSAWNTTPIPSRTAALTPSVPTPITPSRPSSPATPAHGTGGQVSFIPSAGTGTQGTGNKQLATDDEIKQLTETLYTKEVNSQLALIQVNIQGKTRSIDSADEASNPLLVVDDRALQPLTIVKLRALFNNYEVDTLTNEHVTPNERREENEFLDAVMATNVMRQAMLFLQNKGIVTPDPKTHRDLVKELWFTQYSRGSGKVGSSGFEHVFVNEVKNGTIIGLHNWVYFYEEEKAGRLNYKGYMNVLDIGTKGKVLKARFTHNGLNKPVNTLFIGTSPELELALYTVCFMLRPDRTCPVSLSNSRFGIVVYSWRYRGKNLIGSAYPEI